ncbi:MAG: PAS domain-containing protein, partial [Bdellovibrionota bacterium]
MADKNASLSYLNSRWYEYTGFAPGTVSAEAWVSAIHPEDLAGLGTSWELAKTKNTTWSHEYRLRRKDGVYRWHLGTSVPEVKAGGTIEHWFGTVTDIDDQKRSQSLIAESERTLDQIFSESYSFMTVLSVPDFRYLKSNAQHEKLLRKSGFIGKSVIEVEPELEAQGIIDLLNKVATTGEPFVGTEVPIYYAPFGNEPEKTSYLDFKYQPLKDGSGKVYAILAQGFEVTEKVLARRRVEESQREIVGTIESMSDAFFAIDKDWKIIRVNAHYEKVTQTKREDQIGNDLRELFFSDPIYENSTYLNSYRKAMSERVFVRFEDYYEPLDLWTEVRVYPKTDGGLAIFFTDIGERVQNEKRLLAERKKLEEIFYGADSPMVLFRGPTLVYEMANQKYLEMISFRDVLGKPLAEALPEIAETEFPGKIKGVYESGDSVRFLEGYAPILNPKTGSLEDRYFDTTFARISDGPGRDYLVIGNAMDVTERVLSKRRLEEAKSQTELEAIRADRERAKFEAAFHAVAEGIFIFDSNGNPVFMNDAAAKVFGSATAADVRKRVEYYFERLDLYDLNDELIPLSEWPVARALRGESFREWHIKAHRRDTGDRWIWSSSGELARQAASDVTLAVVVLRDITEQKQSEIELQAAKLEAERANELKSAFLANMSHEIRTPLGAMLGFADLLRDPGLSAEEHTSYIDVLSRNGEQLSFIINDILDLSKVEAGHLTLEYIPASPDAIATDVVSLMRVKAREKDLELEYRSDTSTPREVVSDPLRVRQVLINLVSNAIKFTQSGSVNITSRSTKNSEGRTMVSFEVADTGIGIPEDHVDRIFEVFVQGDGSMTRRFGGTGLGLALSRKLAQKLGGDIEVESKGENRGSLFRFTFE